MQPAEQQWLDAALRRLAAETRYPETPDMEARFAERRYRKAGPRIAAPGFVFRLAAVVAVAVVAGAISIVLSRDARDAIADFLGLGVAGERIEITAPTPDSPAATPVPLFDDLAEPVTLAEARARLPFAIAVPEGADVRAVFLLEFLGLDGVVLRTHGYDVWQFQADTGLYLGKGGPAIRVEETSVGGQPAYWVTGGPRLLSLVDAAGNTVTGIEIVTGAEALVWAEGGITYRIEGALDREEAVAVAEALN